MQMLTPEEALRFEHITIRYTQIKGELFGGEKLDLT